MEQKLGWCFKALGILKYVLIPNIITKNYCHNKQAESWALSPLSWVQMVQSISHTSQSIMLFPKKWKQIRRKKAVLAV